MLKGTNVRAAVFPCAKSFEPCLQIEVMKGNVKSRLQIYYQELEKFKARWDQLKPGDDIIETGQPCTLDQSAKSIKEKKIEFDDLEVIRKKLV